MQKLFWTNTTGTFIYQVKVAFFIFQTYHGLDFKSCLHRSLHNTKATIPTLTTIGHQYAKTTKTTTASQGDTQDDQFTEATRTTTASQGDTQDDQFGLI